MRESDHKRSHPAGSPSRLLFKQGQQQSIGGRRQVNVVGFWRRTKATQTGMQLQSREKVMDSRSFNDWWWVK